MVQADFGFLQVALCSLHSSCLRSGVGDLSPKAHLPGQCVLPAETSSSGSYHSSPAGKDTQVQV